MTRAPEVNGVGRRPGRRPRSRIARDLGNQVVASARHLPAQFVDVQRQRRHHRRNGVGLAPELVVEAFADDAHAGVERRLVGVEVAQPVHHLAQALVLDLGAVDQPRVVDEFAQGRVQQFVDHVQVGADAPAQSMRKTRAQRRAHAPVGTDAREARQQALHGGPTFGHHIEHAAAVGAWQERQGGGAAPPPIPRDGPQHRARGSGHRRFPPHARGHSARQRSVGVCTVLSLRPAAARRSAASPGVGHVLPRAVNACGRIRDRNAPPLWRRRACGVVRDGTNKRALRGRPPPPPPVSSTATSLPSIGKPPARERPAVPRSAIRGAVDARG
jgi:hypothetical protein